MKSHEEKANRLVSKARGQKNLARMPRLSSRSLQAQSIVADTSSSTPLYKDALKRATKRAQTMLPSGVRLGYLGEVKNKIFQ